jgi:hypothetical protein
VDAGRCVKGELADEITNLVEAPTPVMGTFDADFLSLPREVLVMVMRKHQRYFPVEDPDTGALLPYFVTLANGDVTAAVVQEGNEAVRPPREFSPFAVESTTYHGAHAGGAAVACGRRAQRLRGGRMSAGCRRLSRLRE